MARRDRPYTGPYPTFTGGYNQQTSREGAIAHAAEQQGVAVLASMVTPGSPPEHTIRAATRMMISSWTDTTGAWQRQLNSFGADYKGYAGCEEPNCRNIKIETKDLKTCSRCHHARYCSQVCQSNHWQKHKTFCGAGPYWMAMYDEKERALVKEWQTKGDASAAEIRNNTEPRFRCDVRVDTMRTRWVSLLPPDFVGQNFDRIQRTNRIEVDQYPTPLERVEARIHAIVAELHRKVGLIGTYCDLPPFETKPPSHTGAGRVFKEHASVAMARNECVSAIAGSPGSHCLYYPFLELAGATDVSWGGSPELRSLSIHGIPRERRNKRRHECEALVTVDGIEFLVYEIQWHEPIPCPLRALNGLDHESLDVVTRMSDDRHYHGHEHGNRFWIIENQSNKATVMLSSLTLHLITKHRLWPVAPDVVDLVHLHRVLGFPPKTGPIPIHPGIGADPETTGEKTIYGWKRARGPNPLPNRNETMGYMCGDVCCRVRCRSVVVPPRHGALYKFEDRRLVLVCRCVPEYMDNPFGCFTFQKISEVSVEDQAPYDDDSITNVHLMECDLGEAHNIRCSNQFLWDRHVHCVRCRPTLPGDLPSQEQRDKSRVQAVRQAMTAVSGAEQDVPTDVALLICLMNGMEVKKKVEPPREPDEEEKKTPLPALLPVSEFPPLVEWEEDVPTLEEVKDEGWQARVEEIRVAAEIKAEIKEDVIRRRDALVEAVRRRKEARDRMDLPD